MTDHVTNPGHHRGPYADLTDDELQEAYERVAHDPDSPTAPMVLAEMVARKLAES